MIRTAVEFACPVHAVGQMLENLIDGGVAHDGAGRLRPSVAQQVLAAKFDGIDAELVGELE